MANEYVPDEKQGNTTEQLSEVEMGTLLRKSQSNNRKDDPQTWEKNGCTEQEATICF